MATIDEGDVARRRAPISELVRSLVADVTLLLRRDAELARIEMKGKASKAGAAGGLFAAGAALAWFALAAFVAAAVLGLANVLPAWAAALIVGVVLLGVAAVLALVGRSILRRVGPLAPTQAIDTTREDIAWIRRRTDELRTTG